MDSNLLTSRLTAAKRQFNLQDLHHRHKHNLNPASQFDEFEAEDDHMRPLSCPYCYEDFEIASLCNHLEDEHSFENKSTVCPICSIKIPRDVLTHITLQHGNLFKLQRRRRLRRVAIPNNQAFSLLGRDLREAHLQDLLGGGGGAGSSGFRSSSNLTTSVSNSITADPFLSSLVLNFPAIETNDIPKSLVSAVDSGAISFRSTSAPSRAWKPNFNSSLSYEERERMLQQATGRAGFMQDLVLCTLLEE